MSNSDVYTKINYLAPEVESSLHRNGKVYTNRDADGNDSEWFGAKRVPREMVIKDGRQLLRDGNGHRLWRHGFEMLKAPIADPNLDFLDLANVLQKYYPQCADIVKQAIGASRVYAFDHNIRWASENAASTRIKGGQQVQKPIHMMHGDYTLDSAPQRLRDLAKPLGVNDTLRTLLGQGESLLTKEDVNEIFDKGKRFAIINVWRNIDHTQVMRDPLALCDAQTLSSDDLVVFELNYKDRVGENYFAKYSSAHSWWYYPDMSRDEVILIKQWDSAGIFAKYDGAISERDNPLSNNQSCQNTPRLPSTFCLHGAFDDPNTSLYAPERQSIEVRCIALFDD